MFSTEAWQVFFSTPQRVDEENLHWGWTGIVIGILDALPDTKLKDSLLRDTLRETAWTASDIEDVSKQFLAIAREYTIFSIYQEAADQKKGGYDIVSNLYILSPLRPLESTLEVNTCKKRNGVSRHRSTFSNWIY
jgi:hypothetical protein